MVGDTRTRATRVLRYEKLNTASEGDTRVGLVFETLGIRDLDFGGEKRGLSPHADAPRVRFPVCDHSKNQTQTHRYGGCYVRSFLFLLPSLLMTHIHTYILTHLLLLLFFHSFK